MEAKDPDTGAWENWSILRTCLAGLNVLVWARARRAIEAKVPNISCFESCAELAGFLVLIRVTDLLLNVRRPVSCLLGSLIEGAVLYLLGTYFMEAINLPSILKSVVVN